ncbi:hypothetical protein AB1N83_008733 [Pleurotus pulmonarius]
MTIWRGALTWLGFTHYKEAAHYPPPSARHSDTNMASARRSSVATSRPQIPSPAANEEKVAGVCVCIRAGACACGVAISSACKQLREDASPSEMNRANFSE